MPFTLDFYSFTFNFHLESLPSKGSWRICVKELIATSTSVEYCLTKLFDSIFEEINFQKIVVLFNNHLSKNLR